MVSAIRIYFIALSRVRVQKDTTHNRIALSSVP